MNATARTLLFLALAAAAGVWLGNTTALEPPRWQLIPGSWTAEIEGKPSDIRPTVWKFDASTGRTWMYRYRLETSTRTIRSGWMEIYPLETFSSDQPPQKPPHPQNP